MGGVYSLRDLLAGGSTETVDPFRTSIPYNRESEFQDWTRANRITDLDHPDSHYDYRGAFLEGVKPEVAPDGVAHWPDTYKTPGHPTFSVESKYAAGRSDAGSWQGDQFVPPQGGGGEYSLRDLLASAGPPAVEATVTGRSPTLAVPSDALATNLPRPHQPEIRAVPEPGALERGAKAALTTAAEQFNLGQAPIASPAHERARTAARLESGSLKGGPEDLETDLATGIGEFVGGMAPLLIPGAEVAAPTVAMPFMAGEKMAMAALERAAKAGIPFAQRVVDMAASPEGATLVQRAVSRAVRGAATGGTGALAATTTETLGKEGRLPTASEAAESFAGGTVLTPAIGAAGEVLGTAARKLLGSMFDIPVDAPPSRVVETAKAAAEHLGVDLDKTPQSEIDALIRKAAKQYHADVNRDPAAAQTMQDILAARSAINRYRNGEPGYVEPTVPTGAAEATESAPGRSAEPPPVSSRQQAGVTSPAEAAPTPATEPYKLSELLNEAGTGRPSDVTAPEAVTPPERTAPPERGPVSAAAPIHENTLSTLAMARELAEAGASLKGPELEAAKARIIEKYAPEKPAAVPTPPAAAVAPPPEAPSAPELGQVPRATGTGEPFTSNDVGKALSILNASDNDLIVQREQLQGQLAKIPEAQRNHPTAQDLASNLDVVNHEIAGRGGLRGIQEEMGVAPQGGKPAEAGPAPAAGAVTPPETSNRQVTVAPEPSAVEPPRLGPAPTEPEKPTLEAGAPVVGVKALTAEREALQGRLATMDAAKGMGIKTPQRKATVARLAEVERLIGTPTGAIESPSLGVAPTEPQRPVVTKAKGEPHRIWTRNNGFVEVPDAKPAKLDLPAGFEDFRFMVHKAVGQPGWSVTEASTGANIVVAKTKAAALTAAAEKLVRRGPEELRAGVASVAEKIKAGEAERTGQEAPPTAIEPPAVGPTPVEPPRPRVEPGAARDQAAVQEDLLGKPSLVGNEQAEMLPANAGVPTAKMGEGKIGAEEIGRVKREGGEPEGERPLELSPEDAALDDLRGHAHAVLVHEMALERGSKGKKPLTEGQLEKLKHAALDERDAIQAKIEKYAETHGMAAAEALRGKLWNEVKAAAPEPAKEKDPRAKFTKMTDEQLADRHVELIERFQREDARAQKGIHQWSRRDENMEGLVRSGTSFTRDAMYATGRARNASKLLNEVEAEYKARGIDDEAQRRLYEQAEERQAIINEGGEGVSVAEPDVETPDELGESGAVNPQMVNPAKFLGSLYQKIGETEVGDAILRLFAPASRSLPAGQMAHIARANRGQAERDYIVARWALRHAADAAPLLSTPEGLEFTDAIELGQKQPNPELQPVADALRNILDDRRKKIQDLGTGALEEFNANYLGHIWDKGAQSFFKRLLSRRPLEGGKSFLKERSIPTIREGIDAGLQPMVDNPVYMQLLKIREMDKYIAAHRIWNEAKDAKLVQFFSVGRQRPDGYARIDDKIATVFAPPTAEGAMAIRGEYWAPESVARILNNMVSPGLRGNVLYDALMGAGNVLNQAQLGLSLFHAGFTTFDVIVSHLGMAIEDILNGDFKGALKTLPSVVHSPVTNPIRGWQVKMEYREPGSTNDPTLQMIVNALVEGGIRTEMPMENQTNAVERFFQNLRKNPAKLVGKTVAGGVLGGAVGGPTGAVVGAGLSSGILPAILEWATGPVMRHLVPLQKQGVAAELMRRRLERMGPNRTVEEIRTAAAEVVDTVEDRLGQVTYDNYFWHRTMKDVLHLSVRSVGWNWGFFRLVPGGLKDMSAGRFKTYSATYTMALTAMTALAGAVITYLLTGEGPKELRDYIYIKSGVKETEGNQARWVLPSYARDIGAYARHPLDTLLHKLNPLFAGLSEMWQNKDFYGDQIVNPNDPLYRRLQERAEYVGKMFVPFGVRGAIQAGEQEKPGIEQALPFIGVTPAPREAVRSPAQNAMAEYSAQHRPAMRTREEADRAKARQKLMSGLRSGKLTPDDILTKESGGEITHEESQRLIRESAENPDELRFKGLPLDVATRVYKLASPAERGVFKAVLEDKANRGDDADVKAAAEKVLESLPFVEDTSPHTGGRPRPSRPKAPPRPQRPR